MPMSGPALRGLTLGLLFATAASSVHAQPRQIQDNLDPARMAEEIRKLNALVEALSLKLEAQERLLAETRASVQPGPAAMATAPAQAPPPLASAAAPSQIDTSIRWSGAPQFSGGGNRFKVRGRLLVDAAAQEIDRRGTGRDLSVRQVRGRQAFFGVEGELGPMFAYKAEGGWVNGGGWVWEDASITVKLPDNSALIVGNQKSVGLESLTSTRFIGFMDRGPFDSVLDLGYGLGAHYVRTGDTWSLNVGVQGHGLQNADVTPAGDSSNQTERVAVSGRLAWTPIRTSESVLHLGAWARYRKRGDDGGFNYIPNYNSPLRAVTLLQTGAIGDHDRTFALEAAWTRGAVSLQSEFAHMRVGRPGGLSSFSIPTGYAYASWFPTGETRPYEAQGGFGRVKVANPLDRGGTGAVELLARYDVADLTDARTPVLGQYPSAGRYEGWTLGATWYPISYVRFMANYTRGRIDNLGTANDATVDSLQIRGQVDW